MKNWLAAFALTGLAACQSVTSQHVDFTSGRVMDGLQYAAPKALMTVKLVAYGADVHLTISQPFLVGDPAATFALTASSGLFADERYLFVVNPETRLLTYINSVSDGQAAKILVNLARSIGAIQGATTTPGDESADAGSSRVTPVTLYSTVIDPFDFAGCDFAVACELTKLNQTLRQRAMAFFQCDLPQPADVAAQCQRLKTNENYFSVTIDPLFTITTPKGEAVRSAPPSACTSSICYRAPAPYLIGVHVAGVSDNSAVIMMPNESPIMSMTLPAGVFASAKSRVELVHGMPATITVRRESELAAVTAVPISIIQAFFGAVGEVFRLRVNYDNSTVNLLQAEQNRIRAEDAYGDFLEQRRAAQEEAARARSVANALAADPGATQLSRDSANRAADEALQELEEIENRIDDEVPSVGDPDRPSLADGSITARGRGDTTSLDRDADQDVDPFSDPEGSGVADIQQAEITLLDTPRDLFDLHVIDGPGENGSGDADGGEDPDTDIEVDPSVAGRPAEPEDDN